MQSVWCQRLTYLWMGITFSMGMNPYWESIYEALKTQGQQAVNSVKGLGETKGVNVESVLLEGNPSDELIRYAEEKRWILLLWALSEEQDLIGCF